MDYTNNVRKYQGFDSSFIHTLARQNNYSYISEGATTEDESGLYVNQHTDAKKEDLLQFKIEDLECEYYTANFVPIWYATSETGKTMSDTLKQAGGTDQTRYKVQVFSIKLPYNVESIYVESRTNITLNNVLGVSSVAFKESERVDLEGDFSTFFRVYIPKGEEVNAFTILAPNIMVLLLEQAGDYDFEFAGNRIYFYQTFKAISGATTPIKATTYKDLLEFGIKSAKSVVRTSRPVMVKDNFTPMWELYGTNGLVTILILLVFAFYFFTFFYMILIPPLWPVLIIILSPLFLRYYLLMRRRKRLLANWRSKFTG
jgi:hypothetical protein